MIHPSRRWLLISMLCAAGCAGDTGELGPAGEVGPAGPAGPPGETGPAGPAGAQGPTGAQGATGAVGPVGPIGPAGMMGATGATGAMGTAGATGATGAMGAIGPAGATGAMGPVGATGPVGPTGPAGSFVRAVLVSPTGTAAQNGTALAAAYAAVTVAAGERRLVLVEPGTYDLGGTSLALRGGVDLRGMGSSTIIKAASGTPVLSTVNLVAADTARVEDLTLTSVGPGTYVILGSGNGTLVVNDVIASGTLGVRIAGGTVEINRASITVNNYAIDQGGGTAIVRDSQLVSNTTAWYSAPGVLRIVHSQISGATAGSCAGTFNYDGNYAARAGC